MDAAILAIGSELLGTDRLDTNSLRLAEILEQHSIAVSRKGVAGDDLEQIAETLGFLLDRHDIVITTGGLGPTSDDLTKEAVAALLGLELSLDEAILESLKKRFALRGIEMPESNRKQALIFPGHRTLLNARGSAPGAHLTFQRNGRERNLWIFPGVPSELEGMLEADLEPWLSGLGRPPRHRRTLRLAGMAESRVEEELKPFYARYPGMPVTILAGHGQIQIRLNADGDVATASERLDGWERELRDIFGPTIWGRDHDTIEDVVGSLLSAQGATVGVGESCTGGAVGAAITNVAGSSAWFAGGVIAYSREVKMMMLGVDPALIDAHGEVSEEVARDMAEGARRRFHSTWGIGVTGIAGPGGGTEEKPVGTVHVAVASRGYQKHRRLQLPGDRELVRQMTVVLALDMLRRELVAGTDR